MSVAERREARKKRILENLDVRLQRIAGAVTNNEDRDNVFTTSNDQAKHLPAPVLPKENTWKEELTFINSDGNTEPLFSNMNFDSNLDTSKKSQESPFKQLIYLNEFHLILLAVVSYFMLRYDAGFLIYQSVMVPFYTLEFTQVIIRDNTEKSYVATLLSTLLGMYGVSSTGISVIAKVLLLAFRLAKDLCLYLFVFILTTQILN